MATTLSAFSGSEMSVQFREPQISDSLDHKLGVVVPHGIYRGFELTTSVNALKINITSTASPDLDHVAVVRSTNGRSITLHRTTTTTEVNLAAQAGNTVYIAIYANYAYGTTTVAEIRAYTVAEYAALSATAQAAIAILGTVVVPVAGVIPSANITKSGRNPAWEQTATDAVPLVNVLRNGSFELSNASGNAKTRFPYWYVLTTTQCSPVSDYVSGAGSNPILRIDSLSSVSANSFEIYQTINAPIQAGDTVRVKFKKQILKANTLGTTGYGTITWQLPGNGTSLSIISFANNSTDAGFVTVDGYLTAPATAIAIARFSINFTNYLPASTGAAMYIDDVRVLKKSDYSELASTAVTKASAPIHAGDLTLDPGGVGNLGGTGTTRLSVSGSGLLISDPDPAAVTQPNVEIKGNLTVDGTITGSLSATGLDATDPTHVTVGTVTAGGVDLSRTGKQTKVFGDLRVEQTSLFNNDLTAATKLKTPIIDNNTAVDMTIGPTTATGVTISKTGAVTTINGNLTVNQTSDFYDNVSLHTKNLSAVGTLTATTGNITTVSATSVSASANITSSGGNIAATVGNVTAGGNVTATSQVSGATVSASGNITSTGGNVAATAGNVSGLTGTFASSGNNTALSSTGSGTGHGATLTGGNDITAVSAGLNAIGGKYSYGAKITGGAADAVSGAGVGLLVTGGAEGGGQPSNKAAKFVNGKPSAPHYATINIDPVSGTPSISFNDGDVWVENISGSWAVKIRMNSITSVVFAANKSTITYSASMTPDGSTGTSFYITATNGTGFTINEPTNAFAGIPYTICVKNSSGGALGPVTWGGNYKLAANTWTSPANGKNISITFQYDGTHWNEISRVSADVDN